MNDTKPGSTPGAPTASIESPGYLLGTTRSLTILGASLIAGFFGFFLLWSFLAPIDEGVVAPGVVQLESKRKPIQHPNIAVIGKVFVKEGQTVKAGELLVQLDDSQSAAAYASARAQMLALRAAQSRLNAESVNAASVTFDPMLFTDEYKVVAQEFVQREGNLFAARKASLSSDLSVLQQSIVAAQEQEKALQAQLDGRKNQLAIVAEQIKSSRDLAKEGFISRTKLLDEERLSVDLNAQVNELLANIQRARSSVAELKLRMTQRQREFAREVDTQSVEVRRDLAGAAERVGATRAELGRTKIFAPVDGTVVGLAIQSTGAVVPEGGRIMDIVPTDESLLIDAQIPPEVIDRIRAGLAADVRFTGFSDLPFLALEGRVMSVSADRLEEGAANRPPYFLARIQVTPESLKKLGQHKIQPGMAVEVIVKTGERSLMAYLLKPLVRRVSASMTER
ncbi:MAG: HlyD family type I secretion periplasmic adaptor subunit [Pseudomonadota bacterium]